jgi:hypothetical protein
MRACGAWLIAASIGVVSLYALTARDASVQAAEDDAGKKARALYKKGKDAYKAKDYVTSAQAFQQAYELKPHHDALWNAAHSYREAGQQVEAANLYARYLREAPESAKDRDEAIRALKDLSGKLAKVEVNPAAAIKDVMLDGKPYEGFSVYVTPGEHTASGKVQDGVNDGQTARSTQTVKAGQAVSLALEPPPPPTVIKKVEVRVEDKGLPWVIPVIGAGLTIGAAAVMTWSGLDTNSRRNEFNDIQSKNRVDDRLPGLLDDGKSAQTRTNILLVTTGVLAVATGVLAYFVNWKTAFGGGEKPSTTIDKPGDKGGEKSTDAGASRAALPMRKTPDVPNVQWSLGVGSIHGSF